MEVCFNAESVEQSCSVRFCLPAVHGCEFRFQLTCFDSVLVCEIFFCIDDFFFFHDLVQTCIPHDDGVQYQIFIVFVVILLQERKTLSGSDVYFPFGRLDLSGQNL